MAQRRVIVGFDPSSTGRNALWWAMAYADRLDVTLFVVSGRPTSRVARPRPSPFLPDDRSAETQVAVADALLLAVGEPPPGLDIQVATVRGSTAVAVHRLADRCDDVVVLARVPRRWRSPAVLFVVTDPLSPPTNHSTVHNGRGGAQASRFLPR